MQKTHRYGFVGLEGVQKHKNSRQYFLNYKWLTLEIEGKVTKNFDVETNFNEWL